MIPNEWRRAVIDALRSDEPGCVLTTRRADKDWAELFPDAFEYERFEAMAAVLEHADVKGRRVIGMSPPGMVYAFFFRFHDMKLYGKINLLPSGRVILVYSNHPPEWETT